METKKKKKNYFMQIVIALFIMFLVVYIVGESGYYESTLHNETVLTNEQIKKFEEDVINGETVDLNNYLLEEKKDYSNIFTKTGEAINNGVITLINDGALGVMDVFGSLFS